MNMGEKYWVGGGLYTIENCPIVGEGQYMERETGHRNSRINADLEKVGLTLAALRRVVKVCGWGKASGIWPTVRKEHMDSILEIVHAEPEEQDRVYRCFYRGPKSVSFLDLECNGCFFSLPVDADREEILRRIEAQRLSKCNLPLDVIYDYMLEEE